MTRRGWTADDIPVQGGRVAVVTGANSGLGLATALQLATHGAHVVMACRDERRGEAALARVLAAQPRGSVALARLDLADLASVHDVAGRIAEQHADGINLLVCNAGVMATPRRLTADGFELQLGTNHFGHFALTGLLLPALLRPGARVVTVSSNMHHSGRMNFSDLDGERTYQPWKAYAQSKLANLLFALELDRRSADVDLTSVAAHPGWAATNLQGVGPQMRGSRVGAGLAKLANVVIAQSDARGALPQLYAATMPDVRGGEYFGPDGFREMRGNPRRVLPSAHAQDTTAARLLWEESERRTGVHYDLLTAPA